MSTESDRRWHHARFSKGKLGVAHPASHRFKKIIDYHTHRPANTSTKYVRLASKHLAIITRKMTAQMKPLAFNYFDQVSIVEILKHFKLACDTNGVHKSTVVWLFHFIMDKLALIYMHGLELTVQTKSPTSRLAKRQGTLQATHRQSHSS